MANVQGVKVQVVTIEEQVITNPDGWAIYLDSNTTRDNKGPFGYHFNFHLNEDQEVFITLSEDAIVKMLDDIRSRWPLESRS